LNFYSPGYAKDTKESVIFLLKEEKAHFSDNFNLKTEGLSFKFSNSKRLSSNGLAPDSGLEIAISPR